MNIDECCSKGLLEKTDYESKSMRRFLIPLLIFLLAAVPASAKEPIRIVEGVVKKVSDGDTITVFSDSKKLEVMLYGIDAPETEKVDRKTGIVKKPGQPYGYEAWRALEAKVAGKKVKLDIMDIDRCRRMVSIVWLDNRNINREMVAEGWAWAYREHLDRLYAFEFLEAEEKARAKRLGLWRQYNPQPQWNFRRFFGSDYGQTVVDVVEIFSSLLSPIIAIVVTYIAIQQWKTNRSRLRHEVFDRRFVIYDAAQELIRRISSTCGKIEDSDLTIYDTRYLPGKFILRSNTFQYLQLLEEKAKDLLLINDEIKDMEDKPNTIQKVDDLKKKRRDLVHWFREQPSTLNDKFDKDLTLRF